MFGFCVFDIVFMWVCLGFFCYFDMERFVCKCIRLLLVVNLVVFSNVVVYCL